MLRLLKCDLRKALLAGIFHFIYLKPFNGVQALDSGGLKKFSKTVNSIELSAQTQFVWPLSLRPQLGQYV